MSELELVTKLAVELARQLRSPIPLTIDLWDVGTIAKYLKREDASVRERIICLPDFPKAIRLPSQTGRRGHPLYKATEVIAWVEKFKEKS